MDGILKALNPFCDRLFNDDDADEESWKYEKSTTTRTRWRKTRHGVEYSTLTDESVRIDFLKENLRLTDRGVYDVYNLMYKSISTISLNNATNQIREIYARSDFAAVEEILENDFPNLRRLHLDGNLVRRIRHSKLEFLIIENVGGVRDISCPKLKRLVLNDCSLDGGRFRCPVLSEFYTNNSYLRLEREEDERISFSENSYLHVFTTTNIYVPAVDNTGAKKSRRRYAPYVSHVHVRPLREMKFDDGRWKSVKYFFTNARVLKDAVELTDTKSVHAENIVKITTTSATKSFAFAEFPNLKKIVALDVSDSHVIYNDRITDLVLKNSEYPTNTAAAAAAVMINDPQYSRELAHLEIRGLNANKILVICPRLKTLRLINRDNVLLLKSRPDVTVTKESGDYAGRESLNEFRKTYDKLKRQA